MKLGEFSKAPMPIFVLYNLYRWAGGFCVLKAQSNGPYFGIWGGIKSAGSSFWLGCAAHIPAGPSPKYFAPIAVVFEAQVYKFLLVSKPNPQVMCKWPTSWLFFALGLGRFSVSIFGWKAQSMGFLLGVYSFPGIFLGVRVCFSESVNYSGMGVQFYWAANRRGTSFLSGFGAVGLKAHLIGLLKLACGGRCFTWTIFGSFCYLVGYALSTAELEGPFWVFCYINCGFLVWSLDRKDINPTLNVCYCLSRVYIVSLITPQSLFWVSCLVRLLGGMPLVKSV
ncbi:hypothetical protein HanHA300_Chr10g0344001 [Helianthus annuus]|nr:hypothetical protein HanHA300_Chr10g0344001 [Helianthus annuus]KAJ0528339.1 hypothetical protein HanHA89_Chr10g0365241 [Helianthus annuus]